MLCPVLFADGKDNAEEDGPNDEDVHETAWGEGTTIGAAFVFVAMRKAMVGLRCVFFSKFLIAPLLERERGRKRLDWR
ncbi:hypothetical protein NL676_005730 [Syzygium grande]|nr:hypothetical protein NL676_005730 [Syzygium grande]